MKKYLIHPLLLRQIPRHFSWIDHRLIRDGYINQCCIEALALYLVLVTVADARGLSYYSDRSLCKLLRMGQAALEKARSNLIEEALIAYQSPLYQILSLDHQIRPHSSKNERRPSPPSTGEDQDPRSTPEFIEKIIEELRRSMVP